MNPTTSHPTPMPGPGTTRPAHRRWIACCTLALVLPSLHGTARAEEPASLSFNVGAVSEYRYRGISQTRFSPALQGGVDYALPSGWYVGAWGSTIRWVKDAFGNAPLEVDLYGGYKTEIAKNVTIDAGLLQYLYPNAKTPAWSAAYKDPNTLEAYGALSVGPVTAKLSYALTDLFGNYDFAAGRGSKGSTYLDLSGSFDVGGGVMLTPHIGYQRVRNIGNASYADFSLAVSKDFGGIVPSLTLVGTNADKTFYVPGGAANSTRFLGRTTVVLGLKAVF